MHPNFTFTLSGKYIGQKNRTGHAYGYNHKPKWEVAILGLLWGKGQSPVKGSEYPSAVCSTTDFNNTSQQEKSITES